MFLIDRRVQPVEGHQLNWFIWNLPVFAANANLTPFKNFIMFYELKLNYTKIMYIMYILSCK